MNIIILVGIAVCIVGIIIALPTIFKMKRFSQRTEGVVENIDVSLASSDREMKITYSYIVDNIKYKKTTGWTENGAFETGKRCYVKYDPSNPEKSYLQGSGVTIKVIVGTAFLICGIFILIAGIQLKGII